QRSDSEMEIEAEHYSNGVVEGCSTQVMNGSYNHEEMLQQDDISIGNGIKEHDGFSRNGQLCGGNRAATERIIQFGRELQVLSEQLCREYGKK
ncbi:unnamed protein product, partial [Tetraodon nigroviridis]